MHMRMQMHVDMDMESLPNQSDLFAAASMR